MTGHLIKTFENRISHVQNATNVPVGLRVVAVVAGPVPVLGTAVLPGLPPEQQLYVNNKKLIFIIFLCQ